MLTTTPRGLVIWWAMTGSNCRHLACKASALPAELIAQIGDPYGIRTRVTAVKGRCLELLDQRAIFAEHLLVYLNLNQKSRSEEHTSELQSRPHLVCRLLLE